MTQYQDPWRAPGSRLEERRAERVHHTRKLIVISVCVSLLAVVVAAGAWLGLSYLSRARHKPAPLVTYKVTIPEGFTLEQTAARFAEDTGDHITEAGFNEAVKAGGFEATFPFLRGTGGNLEGYLFPKTYEVSNLATGRDAVDMLLKQFGKETTDLDWSRAQALGITPYQAVIIASMIEKEVKLPEERPLVASVIYNRLKKGWKLGFCSTVEYALGYHKDVLTDKDLQVDSPYNTYKIAGLPPGPICNPGFESLRAALYPATTDFVYFILTSQAEGKHSFTADYQQFLRWKDEQNKKG